MADRPPAAAHGDRTPPLPAPPVRLATPADVDELVRLRAVMMAAVGVPYDQVGSRAGWRANYAAALHEDMASDMSAAFVADEPAAPHAAAGPGGHLVACGVVTRWRSIPGPGTPNGWRGYIASMVTEPAWQGRGLARAVLGELMAWCRERGISRMALHASPDGAALYRSVGFTDDLRFPEMEWRAPASGP
ncbi:MAG TPA: GNAT family N-acetyltransferase [Acidimicrobiales bacterium]|nr:GNAT family N-acetyltransferase [Acidimicrobiales bacterium]